MGKRVNGRFFIDQCAEGGSHGCNYLLTVNMETEPVDGLQLASWCCPPRAIPASTTT